MWRAWVGVRRNDGAGSIDRIAPDAVEEYGVTRILDALVTDLREDRWHPMPFRRVFIPKSGSAERRAPCRFAVRDRIVQTSLQTVPIFDRPTFCRGTPDAAVVARPARQRIRGLRKRPRP
jgi:RNA-directed DNA polymerase